MTPSKPKSAMAVAEKIISFFGSVSPFGNPSLREVIATALEEFAEEKVKEALMPWRNISVSTIQDAYTNGKAEGRAEAYDACIKIADDYVPDCNDGWCFRIEQKIEALKSGEKKGS